MAHLLRRLTGNPWHLPRASPNSTRSARADRNFFVPCFFIRIHFCKNNHQISTISTRKKTQGPLPWNLFRIFIIYEISTHNRICTCLYPSCTAVCATTSIIGPGYRPTCTGSPLHLHRRTWHLGLSLVPKTSGFALCNRPGKYASAVRNGEECENTGGAVQFP